MTGTRRTEKSSSAELRRLAEERLREKPSAANHVQTEADLRRLQHELEVHQIELEMQNEELQRAQAETRAALEKYTDLYDFAPTGYFSLACDGTITAVNLTGARLVGIERARLLNLSFVGLVLEADRPTFRSFLERTFTGIGQETCELTLPREGASSLVVRIEAVLSNGGQECRASVHDVTERAVLEQKMHNYDALLRILIARSSEPMLLIDGIGTILCASDRAAAELGYSLGEFEGASVLRFLHDGDRLAQALYYEDLKKRAPLPSDATLRVFKKDGGWCWVSAKVTFEDYLRPSGKYLVKFDVVNTFVEEVGRD